MKCSIYNFQVYTLAFAMGTMITHSNASLDFPGGPVVKNLPTGAGDTNLNLGLGKFHVPQGD